MKRETFTGPKLKTQLFEYLGSTPLDFIRELNFENHRHEVVDEYCREISKTNDLRHVTSQSDGRAYASILEVLPWDTEFFGYKVAKLSAVVPLQKAPDNREYELHETVGAIAQTAREHQVRYLFSAVDPRDLSLIRALCENGFALIETRVYYHRSLGNYAYPERFAVRPATSADIPSLSQAAEVMVNTYDRFHADPFIRREDANRLMREWVRASIDNGFADITIVPEATKPTAFCTVKYLHQHWQTWGLKLAQPVLSAVSPEFKGWYSKIISEVSFHLKEIGATHAYMATQVTNKAVVSVWEKLGYRFGKAEHIFRKVFS